MKSVVLGIGFAAAVTTAGAIALLAMPRSRGRVPDREQTSAPEPIVGPVGDSPSERSAPAEVLAGPGPQPSATVATAPEPVDPAESRRLQLEAHRKALGDHYRDAIDPHWARSAQRQFHDDLSAWESRLGFETKAVDCRTTSCVATLSFTNYQTARASWMRVLTLPYGVNCTREVTLDEPTEDGRPFETTVVFDCVDDRARVE